MKVRIQDNSVRFRLTQKDVACLRDTGRVESGVLFPTGALRYSVSASPEAAAISIVFEDSSIRAVIPQVQAEAWVEGAEVGLAGSDSGIDVLVEKDFQCLHNSDRHDPDAYPNPLA